METLDETLAKMLMEEQVNGSCIEKVIQESIQEKESIPDSIQETERDIELKKIRQLVKEQDDEYKQCVQIDSMKFTEVNGTREEETFEEETFEEETFEELSPKSLRNARLKYYNQSDKDKR